MGESGRISTAVLSAVWLWACSEDPSAPNLGTPPTAQSPSSVMPQPPGTGTGTGTQPAAPPNTGTPAAQEPTGAAGSAAPSTTDEPAMPGMMEPAAPVAEPRYPDACAERRASWSRPCSDDPDPCGLNSGFEGDEYCLRPPPEGEGVQIHFGPKSYDDPAEVAKYVLEPDQEINGYGIVNIPTTEEHWYSYVKLSMRPGSHHVINNIIAGHPEEGFVTSGTGCEGSSIAGFVGTQVLIQESPPQGIPAPENEGFGRSLPGNASICQNYHRYNFTDKPIISEIWYNVWFTDEEKVTQKGQGVSVFAGPFAGIPPGTRQVLTTTTTVTGDGRIISLFGHRHAATERFAAFLNDELIYDSWDWVEARVFNYDSITENPPINTAGMMDGAASGIIEIKNGDKIKVECHVNNTTDQTLFFSNELYTGEMCILFGSSVGVGIR